MTLRTWITAVILALILPSAAKAASNRIDPVINIAMRDGVSQTMKDRHLLVKTLSGVNEPVIETLVRFTGGLEGVKSLGGVVHSVIGDVATVDIPLSVITQVSDLPEVVYVERAKRLRPRLNLSVPSTKADIIRTGTPPQWTGNTGRNVVVGVIDSGIDLNHADFKNSSNNSRILYLWDQAATSGTPPGGYTYGNECTNSTIDGGTCKETDADGHGTHVSGIAAGNGSATGNGYSAYRYVGMAPEADIIMVNSLSGSVTATNAIVDAIAYIQAKAASLGKPSVINMSFGSDLGPHDGTSNYERSLDGASGAGKILVGAAGNEADANIHASGTVTQGGSTTVDFRMPSFDYAEQIDIWYAGSDTMDIVVSNGTCTTTALSPGATNTFNTSCGRIAISSSDVNPNNGDREISVILYNMSAPLPSGHWSITLTGTSVTSGKFDAWFEFYGSTATNIQFTSNVDTAITLDDMGTATQPIAVGAYNTKANGATLTVGDIAPFSSKGPRRVCSLSSACPYVQKPDVAAPGRYIMSSFSASTTKGTYYSSDLDPDGAHIMYEGTSMSSPHVTGAVALLLQASPTLTPDDIRGIFSAAAAPDTYTGTLPNDTWGYGKIDVSAAFAATPNATPSAPTGLTASAGNPVTLNWNANTELDIDGYNIYRSASSAGTFSAIGSAGHDSVSYSDSAVTASTTYYYKITAYDTAGHESAYSAQSSATAEAQPADGGGSGSSSGGKSGCFIATAAYGTEMDGNVVLLRSFRDNVLMPYDAGRFLVRQYYRFSPPVAEIIRSNEPLRSAARAALTPVIYAVKYPLPAAIFFTGIGIALPLGLRKRRKKSGRK